MARQSNLGEILDAALKLSTAARECQDTDGLPFKFKPLSITSIVAQAEIIEEAALGKALDHIARLVFEIDGKRPGFGEGIAPVLHKIRAILELKGWPEGASDYALQIAADQIPEPDAFAPIFGGSAPTDRPASMVADELAWDRRPKLLKITAVAALKGSNTVTRISFEDFEADNADDPTDMIDLVIAMKPGESRTFGGGAAPAFTVEVVE